MIQSIAHRGPDDSGLAIVDHGRTVLGNTRLAILDLSTAGHQPMRDESNGNIIVFNGEVYNHEEIRRALPGLGPWNSSSDTETVLRSYGALGESCVNRFRGMFAFCIWDQQREALFCARDRMGIKPFFYFTDGAGTFLFASEVRALLASGQVPRTIDQRGLEGFVRFGSVPESLTLIAGVHSLPAGNTMLVRTGRIETINPGAALSEQRPECTERETVGALRRHLERSVCEQLRSDVPVATFLSGGVDSSVITAIAARASSQPIHTITMGFEDRQLDETEYAAAVGRQYKTIQHRVKLSAEEVVNLIPEAVEKCDLPSADGLNTYLVSRAAAQSGIKVVLSGLGGDELFGGYRTFRLLQWVSRVAPVVAWSTPIARLAVAGANGSYQRGVEMLASKDLGSQYSTLRSLWSTAEMRHMGLDSADLHETQETDGKGALFTQISRLELAGYMRSTLLRDADAMSMAHSIELRVPFLDHELVEWCLETGAAEYSRGARKKQLLLEAAADLLPPQTLHRRKQGFTLPMDQWMKGPLSRFVTQGLSALRESALLPAVDLPRLEQRFRAGALPWARLWQFVVLGHWVKRHLGESQ